MQWDPAARVVAAEAKQLQSLPLGPGEYFLWSRIQGPITVAEVVKGSGLPPAEAEATLRRLLELGAARLEAPAPAPPRPRAAASEGPDERRRRTLVAQLAAARGASGSGGAGNDAAPGVQTHAAEVGETAPREPPPWPLVEEDDVRLVADHALPIADQRRILALFDRLEELSPFEILGMWPTHDLKAIRRAYHVVSREFHPDSYFGQRLGEYRDLLAALFRRATAAHEALQDAEVRDPFVDAEIARRAELERRAHEQTEAKRQQAQLLAAQAEAEAAARRHERAVMRANRQRQSLDARLRSQLDVAVAEATEAERIGNLPRAANAWRIALQIVPGDATLRSNWERCRDAARAKRAAEAFARAMTLREVGQWSESVGLLVEAAEAHGTIEHLAHAAEAVAQKDPGLARKFAIGALETLRAEEAAGATPRRPAELARLHVLLARAFHGAGQVHTAKEQAQVAQKLRPGDPEVRALLNSLKLP
ncbi:MAG: J domain-containing protein [Nannocystaceae bacterium]|nr:J domain-containing protein [Nannocystaceae bacterium]